MSAREAVTVHMDHLCSLVARMFVAVGLPEKAARTVASALVEADLEGQHSHGVMLVDMYVDRVRKGSVSCNESAEIISDRDAIAVLDAGNALGQLTGDQAMAIAVEKAKRLGAGIAAVRHAFHFGVARRYALAAAEAGCVGVAMCNTRPLMPAPGGAERIVGNNPLAVALPVAGDVPIALDMATSEAAMGKIRMAAKAGKAIPSTWATRADGTPTTDPAEAISGMLLPAAGSKGFGLAFVVDLLCGLLSGGAWGERVRPLYGDPAEPYDCSQLFIALDAAHFGDLDAVRTNALAAIERIHNSARAPGVDRLYAPGELEWRKRQDSGELVRLEPAVAAMLTTLAAELGIEISAAGLDQAQRESGFEHAKA